MNIIHYLLSEEVMGKFNGQALVNGHIHYHHYQKAHGNKLHLQLGSISRGVLKTDDQNRAIAVTELEIAKTPSGEYQAQHRDHILKCPKPFSEIFDLEAFTKEKEHRVSFDKFTEGILEEVCKTEQYDVNELVRNMPEFSQLTPDVRQVVERYLAKL